MEIKTVHSWILPAGFKLANGDRLIYLNDENGDAIAFMPVWELDYYRRLCGNAFTYRPLAKDQGIGEAVKVVIPTFLAATLPSVMGDYVGRISYETFRALGNYRRNAVYLNGNPAERVRDEYASFVPVKEITVAEALSWGA